MQLEEYLVPGILDNEWIQYKLEIMEFFNLYKNNFIYGQRKNNSELLANDFSDFMQSKNIKIKTVTGDFFSDKGFYSKLNFNKSEIEQMRVFNLRPNVLEDRVRFAKIFNLDYKQKIIKHYWNTDDSGLVIDLSGYSLFVNTEHSADLKIERYTVQNKI